MHTHIIYYATYNNNIIYIGSGLPNRYKHCIFGVSHIYDLNRLHFLEPDSVQVHILKGFTTQEEALEEEKKLILEFKPIYNSQFLNISEERFAKDSKDIEKYKGSFIPIKNEISLRRTLTTYERIEQGLAPSVEHAIQWYEDPETDNETLFKVFPLFNEWISSGITTSMMKTNRLNKELITKKAVEIRTVATNEKSIISKLDLKIGEIYTSKDLVKKLTHIYKQLAIEEDDTVKIKATIIKKWYEIKNTPKKVNGEQHNGYKIIRKL